MSPFLGIREKRNYEEGLDLLRVLGLQAQVHCRLTLSVGAMETDVQEKDSLRALQYLNSKEQRKRQSVPFVVLS